MTMTNTESTTWLDRFPTEIIFHIFDYLLNNDIIYTFFFFNQRFNNLILQNQKYVIHLELPTTNFNFWKNILSIIGSQIESLNITTIDLSFPLSLFPNLKSLIVSSPYGLPDEQLKLIVKNDQFNNLDSFKIKQHKIFSNLQRINHLTNQDKNLLKTVFNNENSLKTFQCSSTIQTFQGTSIDTLKINFNLHSLTLILLDFQDIYSLIKFTPNLNYLNITTQLFYVDYQSPRKKLNIKLKQFYLKLTQTFPKIDVWHLTQDDFDEIMNDMQQLPLSSLTCLSLDFVDVKIKSKNSFSINSIKLQQFLELMPELKRFHLYATLDSDDLNPESMLGTFNDQFWSNHNWSFGTHDQYFYTLPFHFDHFHLNGSFNDVKSNNLEILETNPRLWYNVKSIDLRLRSEYDLKFVKELKMKMPKLTTIQFHDYFTLSPNEIHDLNERAKIQLDNVITVHFACLSIERRRDWLIYALPNVKHLILISAQFPSPESELAPILDKRIEQLYVDANVEQLERLSKTNYIYFSNVQHIHYRFNDYQNRLARLGNVVMQTLKNFQKLKTLTIYRPHQFSAVPRFNEADLNKLVDYLNLNELVKNYEMKRFQEYFSFSKKIFDT